jgi:hypothetical protein
MALNPSDEAPILALLIVSVTVGTIYILRPLVTAWSRRFDTGNSDPALGERVKELERRVADLETQAGRTGELEERLDFAERLLTDVRRREQLPG